MESLFCNECSLSEQIPRLIGEELLGIENLSLLQARYRQMKEGYALSYEEWQNLFTEDLKPFRGYDDTTSVTIPLKHELFKLDFERIGKGPIGLDLPTWFNIGKHTPRIMLIFQDPLRGIWYRDCPDVVLASPFGLHDATHRNHANGGKMADELVKRLIENGCGVYLTDACKYFIYNHKISDAYSLVYTNIYADILEKEINIVRPSLCVLLGNSAAQVFCEIKSFVPRISLPHLSGTARGAIVNRFPILNDLGANAGNIAEMYAREILAERNKLFEIREETENP